MAFDLSLAFLFICGAVAIVIIVIIVFLRSWRLKQILHEQLTFELESFAMEFSYAKGNVPIYMVFGGYTVMLFTFMAPFIEFLYKILVLIGVVGVIGFTLLIGKQKVQEAYVGTISIDAHVVTLQLQNIDVLFRKLVEPVEVPVSRDFVDSIKAEANRICAGHLRFMNKILDQILTVETSTSKTTSGVRGYYTMASDGYQPFLFIVKGGAFEDVLERTTQRLPESFGDIQSSVTHADLIYIGNFKVSAPAVFKEKIGAEESEIPVFVCVLSPLNIRQAINDADFLVPDVAQSAIMASAYDHAKSADIIGKLIQSEDRVANLLKRLREEGEIKYVDFARELRNMLEQTGNISPEEGGLFKDKKELIPWILAGIAGVIAIIATIVALVT